MGIVSTATDKYQKCIDQCNRCAQACEECLKLCLNEPDVQARKNCIATLIECARYCRDAACFMSFDAQYAKAFCNLCATVCNKCSADCAMFKDDHCVKCADECKSCANECSAMAQ
ncbi:putative cysteine-rich protein YhjQ [Caprobacter fermentans]|uniref:Four-helix bundle copper-binding protein n=1 Tax=Caproicibacter fermentans TaxID=2576756 RepID=A0A6N8HX66_9FIRM|nr:four-helix bundle copper-binding protein [Caproicibacter fermentans]MVB09983.1 putative cysteine-rich protein YhjQ [Caproicibacter fermentans]OCN00236.1 four-helix bundle copper-binding protein [Clostridium sp. W14A]QNK42071.1 four-helix bundle copper-binding protein [Caproicibacter fermentans]